MEKPLILGIESTCDETGVAFVCGHELLADVTATSMDQHARYGGIIPEIASRAHLESFLPTLEAAAEKAGVKLADVDAIACAAGPGLVGSLTVGISAAKALALALDKPLYGVNHVIGHLAVDQLVDGPFPEKFIGLIVSGGHSNLVYVGNIATDVRSLGGTLDDAAGEAFDKVGRLLNTPYPGGPHVDKLASQGNPNAIRFPRGLAAGKDKERHRYDFSFSGLKTAVARYVEAAQVQGVEISREDICAGFSESVNDSLTAKAIAAAKDYGCNTIVVGGGFSANSRLRSLFAERAEAAGIKVRIPALRFCTDNGAQIAALGANLVEAGCTPSPIDFGPDSGMPLTQVYMQGEGEPTYFWEQPDTATPVKKGGVMGQIKDNVEHGIEQARPHIESAIEKAKPYAEQAYEVVRPYAEQAYEAAKPYAERAWQMSEQAYETAKPYAEQAYEAAKPYAEKAASKAKEVSEQAGHKLQEKIQEYRKGGEPSVTVEPPDDVEPLR